MNVTPNPQIKDDALLLLQQDDQTYKIKFEKLADNVLNVIVNGGGDTPGDPSRIELGDMLDVSTDIYINGVDTLAGSTNRGNPTNTAKFTSGKDINSDNIFWMLQWVNNNVGGPHRKPEGEFVLRDPKEFFAEGVSGAIELNSLNDVTTRMGPDASFDFKDHVEGDSFLLCVKEAADKTEFPDYQPYSLTFFINDNINNPNRPGGGINISIDNLIDVNPNFDTVGDELKPHVGRLELTGNFVKDLPGAIKYHHTDASKLDDDILVYISDPSTMIDNYDGRLATGQPAPDDKAPLVAGWYYAAQYYGPPLKEAGLSSGDLVQHLFLLKKQMKET